MYSRERESARAILPFFFTTLHISLLHGYILIYSAGHLLMHIVFFSLSNFCRLTSTFNKNLLGIHGTKMAIVVFCDSLTFMFSGGIEYVL